MLCFACSVRDAVGAGISRFLMACLVQERIGKGGLGILGALLGVPHASFGSLKLPLQACYTVDQHCALEVFGRPDSLWNVIILFCHLPLNLRREPASAGMRTSIPDLPY